MTEIDKWGPFFAKNAESCNKKIDMYEENRNFKSPRIKSKNVEVHEIIAQIFTQTKDLNYQQELKIQVLY
jgi:hypothetical protein